MLCNVNQNSNLNSSRLRICAPQNRAMHAQAASPHFQNSFPPSRLSCVGPYWQRAASESQPWQQKQHKCSSSDGGGVQEDEDVCITEKSLTYRADPTWLCAVFNACEKVEKSGTQTARRKRGKKKGGNSPRKPLTVS